MQRAIHSRFFSVVYSTPKRSDVNGSVIIRIQNINFTVLICTFKDLVSAFTNMLTTRTGLRSVTRFYDNQFNTIKQRLIFKEVPQLPKIPTSEFSSKLFVSAFRRKTNIGKVFNRNSFALFLSGLYKGFANSMVQNGSRCSFSATKAFQEAFSPFRPFALNRTANRLSFFSVLVYPISRMFNTIRSRCQSYQTKIHTHKTFHVINIFFGNINGLKKVKLSIFVNQIRFPFDVRQISRIMANKLNLLPATNAPQGNDIVRLVSHDTVIISNASKWSKVTFGFLINLVGIGNLCNRTYQALGRKFKRYLVRVVNFVMEFEVIKDTFRPSNFGNSIANSICFPDSFKEQIRLFISRQKFYFQREFHNANILNIFTHQKIITNFVKQFKAWQSHSSQPPFGIVGFPAPIL